MMPTANSIDRPNRGGITTPNTIIAAPTAMTVMVCPTPHAAPISAEPGKMGCREVDEAAGLPSRTEFKLIERFEDGTALLEARPITGRTNQIRLHLAQLGWPVVGDQAYGTEQQLGDTQTLSPNDPPLCLHSWRITFTHPLTGKRVSFEAEPPAWAERKYAVAASV